MFKTAPFGRLVGNCPAALSTGVIVMCDYSLHGIKNRLAVEGEQLVVHRFSTGSIGLTEPASVAAPAGDTPSREACAVCVPPGARLRLQSIPETMRRELGADLEEEVTFTQLTAEPFMHRDALRFKSGSTILLQKLEPGQFVHVLDLSLAEERAPAEVTVNW
jgi:hypothetical protein